jgi:hypothetical protein
MSACTKSTSYGDVSLSGLNYGNQLWSAHPESKYSLSSLSMYISVSKMLDQHNNPSQLRFVYLTVASRPRYQAQLWAEFCALRVPILSARSRSKPKS